MRFDFVSPKFCQILALTEEDLSRDPSLAFSAAHPEDSESLIEDNQHATETGTSFHWEGRYVVNEKIIWLEISSEPSLLPNGDTLWSGLIKDITERKNAEDLLKNSEQSLNDAQRIAHIGSWEWDITTNSISWSDELCRIYGMEPDEIEPSFEGFLSILNADTKIIVTKAVDNALSGKAEYDIEFPITFKNSEERFVHAQAIVIRDQDGKPLRMIGSTLDITERKQAEESLRIEKDNLKNIFKAMADGVYIVNEQYDIQYVNPVLENVFGVYNGRKCYEYFHDRTEFCTWCKNPDVYAGKTVHWEWYSSKNQRTYDLIDTPLKNSDGSISKLEIFRDITERKQAEKEKENLQRELQQSQKMEALGKLTGGIAHEYNNMLAIILGFSGLLNKSLIKEPKLLKYTNEIQRAGNRAAKLTSKLLTFSRQKTLEAESLNLNELLQKQRHMLEKTLTVRIQLTFNLQENLWPVWLDGGGLEDAILNMSINAMHAIENNGQLTIQTSNQNVNQMDAQSLGIEPGDYVLLSFTDTGCGIDKENKEKIFDPFFTTKGEKGTGLGLSMVYGFAQNSGGVIKVHSELGQDTQFTLYFPRHYGSSRVQSLTVDSPVETLKDNKSILVVDDESSLLDLTNEILSLHGFKVFCAERAKEALNILQHETIDILISDVIMPEMDGYQLAAIVKEKYPEIKIQLASGFTDNRNMGMVDEHLENNLLHKPFSSEKLLLRMRELCNGNDRSSINN